MKKKCFIAFLCQAMTISMLACGAETAQSEKETGTWVESNAEIQEETLALTSTMEIEAETEETLATEIETTEEGKEDFLSQIQGTYIELFPEMAKEAYRDIWLEATGAIVGEENAGATTDMLLSMCMAEPYGEDAIKLYAEAENQMAFNCFFIGGPATFTVEGNTITGVNEAGEEVFSHTYSFVETDENGMVVFESDDEASGQFTYFSFAPDTMDSTYHLEFRYAEDREDLNSWFEGNYAYWNAAAIEKGYTEEQMVDVITLFATENLSSEE